LFKSYLEGYSLLLDFGSYLRIFMMPNSQDNLNFFLNYVDSHNLDPEVFDFFFFQEKVSSRLAGTYEPSHRNDLMDQIVSEESFWYNILNYFNSISSWCFDHLMNFHSFLSCYGESFLFLGLTFVMVDVVFKFFTSTLTYLEIALELSNYFYFPFAIGEFSVSGLFNSCVLLFIIDVCWKF
jgi:hypothetical protein